MGYRSDVRAIIYGPTDDMQRFIAAAKLDNNHKEVFDNFDPKIYTVNAKSSDSWSVLDMQCYSAKWYPDYPDVRAWHGFMSEVEDDAEWSKLNYEFVRIGEEDGDIEWDRSSDCDYILSTSRPVAEVDICRSHITEGFPDETDQNSASQE